MAHIHIGEKLRHLVPSEFEPLFVGKSIYSKKARGWSAPARRFGLFFDLSRVEWFELSSLVQLILLVESAIREGIEVKLALPLPHALKWERVWMLNTSVEAAAEEVQNRIKRRSAARSFLDHLQIKRALRAEHLKEQSRLLQILEDYDPGSEETQDEEQKWQIKSEDLDSSREVIQQERLYRNCFPLTWVSRDQTQDMETMARFLLNVIGKSSRGLVMLDASTIANVILYELVDNVAEHATKTSWALIAAWAGPEGFRFNPKNYLVCERGYIEWVSQRRTTFVEVVVGDSGVGVPQKLTESYRQARAVGEPMPTDFSNETANVMIWAFDRWSSSKYQRADRGTRGLYRVDRVVRKYNGLITMRSEDKFVGWDHGGHAYDVAICSDEKLSVLPGTVLRLRLPAFHEESLSWRDQLIEAKSLNFEIFSVSTLSDQGMTSSDVDKLKPLLQKTGINTPFCVIVAIRESSYPREAVEAVLRQLVEIRHPSAVVLCGLPGGWSAIESAVDSVNSEYEKRRLGQESVGREHFEIWDPVLVVLENGDRSHIWVGASDACRKVLDGLVNEGGRLSPQRLKELLPDQAIREFTLRQLRNDRNLVAFREDETIEIQFTASDIAQKIGNMLASWVSGLVSAQPSGHVYRTPSLSLVKKWLDLREIVARVCGPQLASLALSIRLKANGSWKKEGPAEVILADSMADSDQVQSLRRSLGINRIEVMSGEEEVLIPPRIPLLHKQLRVLIYCDIVSSGEAARRCAEQVLRDEAVPVTIACLFDARREKSSA